MSVEFICWLTAAFALVALWLHHTQLSRHAVLLARQHLQQQNLQFLDQSAVLNRLRIAKSRGGRFCLERTYQFEFSPQGDRRYYGWITLAGKRLHGIELQPFRETMSH